MGALFVIFAFAEEFGEGGFFGITFVKSGEFGSGLLELVVDFRTFFAPEDFVFKDVVGAGDAEHSAVGGTGLGAGVTLPTVVRIFAIFFAEVGGDVWGVMMLTLAFVAVVWVSETLTQLVEERKIFVGGFLGSWLFALLLKGGEVDELRSIDSGLFGGV